MLWLQMYVKLSEINGAASFNNLGPMLSKPVARFCEVDIF